MLLASRFCRYFSNVLYKPEQAQESHQLKRRHNIYLDLCICNSMSHAIISMIMLHWYTKGILWQRVNLVNIWSGVFYFVGSVKCQCYNNGIPDRSLLTMHQQFSELIPPSMWKIIIFIFMASLLSVCPFCDCFAVLLLIDLCCTSYRRETLLIGLAGSFFILPPPLCAICNNVTYILMEFILGGLSCQFLSHFTEHLLFPHSDLQYRY